MSEAGFPNTHTTTTTTTTTTSYSKSGIFLDFSYLHTTAGRLKCAEIALNLLGFICVLCTILKYLSRGNWFITVSMGGFWFTSIMLAFYIFHVTDKLRIIPWIKIEFVFCAIWTLFYLIAASLLADYGAYDEAFAAGAFFGFAAMLCYGYDAYLKWQDIQFGVTTTTVEARTTTTPNNAY